MGGGGGGGKRLRKAIDLLLPTASVPWRRPCVGFVKKEFAASFLDSERLGGGGGTGTGCGRDQMR